MTPGFATHLKAVSSVLNPSDSEPYGVCEGVLLFTGELSELAPLRAGSLRLLA